jgi:hypothetical protein
MEKFTETTTAPMNLEPGIAPGQLRRDDVHTPVAYAANILKAFNEEKSKGEIAKEKATFYYKASLVQRSIVDHNLEFLETAFINGRVRIKINGLIAEGVTTEPGTLAWSVSRSPISSWCHGCFQIIGTWSRYGEHHAMPSSYYVLKVVTFC